jgi:hypothetical protein
MSARIKYVLLFYASIAIILLFSILLNQRNYQDTWILQDIFIPTFVYIFTFTIVAVMIKDNRIMALVCSSFIIFLNAIPNLKYQFFYGTYDSAGHFGFTKNLLSQGHVPQTGIYSSAYSSFPGMHIVISSLSLITGADINGSFKFFSSIIYGTIPLLVYLVTNRFFDKEVQKNIVIASSLPIVMSYVITGTTFGALLFCFFFYMLLLKNLLKENDRKFALILTVIGFGLLISHAVTMLASILFSCIMLILLRFIGFTKKTSYYIGSHRKVIGILILLSVLFIAWLMFRANPVFKIFINSVEKVFSGKVTKTPIPQRFFEIPLLDQLKILILKYIKDAMILTLSLAGVLVLLKKFKHKNNYLFNTFFLPIICLLGAISLFLALQFVTGFGEIEYRRFIDYALLFSPYFVGLFLWHINERFKAAYGRKRFSGFIKALILFLCISISIVQVFPYQPSVPKANDLPEGEYIVDLRMVNTIYQVKMILFAEKFASKDAKITSDKVTRWQINGFAGVAFSSRHMYYSPLQPEVSMKIKQCNLFLLHYDGRSGPLNEKVEYRIRRVINEVRNTLGNTIYDNGESFIISQ